MMFVILGVYVDSWFVYVRVFIYVFFLKINIIWFVN